MKKMAALASAALACGLALPGMAFADTTGDTAVKWQLDDSAFNISVPTTFHGVAKADGSLQFADNAKFVNESIFNVYGTHYITAESDGSAVSLVESVTGGNQVAVNVTNGTNSKVYTMGPAKDHAVYNDDMKLAKSSESSLTASGSIHADPVNSPTALFTVEWHFSAKPASNVVSGGTVDVGTGGTTGGNTGGNISTGGSTNTGGSGDVATGEKPSMEFIRVDVPGVVAGNEYVVEQVVDGVTINSLQYKGEEAVTNYVGDGYLKIPNVILTNRSTINVYNADREIIYSFTVA